MCITIDFVFSECGHKATFVRSCREDFSLCGNMVTDPLVSTHADFCNDCFMLPDPRISIAREYQPENSSIDLMTELYQMRHVEDETMDLQVRLQDLPLPDDVQDHSYHSSIFRAMFLLPRDSLDLLFIMVNQRLIPDFWLRVLNGQSPSPLIRRSILHLRQILILNLALHRSRTTLSKTEWYIAMGYELFYHVDSTSSDDDCGICRQPLNEIGEEGVPVRTQCSHAFHLKCLGEWIDVSPHSDCPACREVILKTLEPIHDTPARGPHPEWLISLFPPVPQVAPNNPTLIAQELAHLESDSENARLRVLEADQSLSALEAELQVSRIDLSGTENLSNEYIHTASEHIIRNLTGLSSAADFFRYQSQVRLHRMSLARFDMSSQRLAERRREVERSNDHAQRRYRPTTLALVKAQVDFLIGIIDSSLE